MNEVLMVAVMEKLGRLGSSYTVDVRFDDGARLHLGKKIEGGRRQQDDSHGHVKDDGGDALDFESSG